MNANIIVRIAVVIFWAFFSTYSMYNFVNKYLNPELVSSVFTQFNFETSVSMVTTLSVLAYSIKEYLKPVSRK